jgi:hypothetical protein
MTVYDEPELTTTVLITASSLLVAFDTKYDAPRARSRADEGEIDCCWVRAACPTSPAAAPRKQMLQRRPLKPPLDANRPITGRFYNL